MNKIKNDNSCKVLIWCTIYINFISKTQHPNEKQRLVMWCIVFSEQEINVTLVGFWHAWITSCLMFKNLRLILNYLKKMIHALPSWLNDFWLWLILNTWMHNKLWLVWPTLNSIYLQVQLYLLSTMPYALNDRCILRCVSKLGM